MDIHTWFGLSYSNCLVLDDAVTQNLPYTWHFDMYRMLDELNRAFPHVDRAAEYVPVAGEESYYNELSAEDMARLNIDSNEDTLHEDCDHDPEPTFRHGEEDVEFFHQRYRQWMEATGGCDVEVFYYDDRDDQHSGHDRLIVPTETVDEARSAKRLVVHRTLLQSMPEAWQARFVELLSAAGAVARSTPDVPDAYDIRTFDSAGRPCHDPVPHYNRGRTCIDPYLSAITRAEA